MDLQKQVKLLTQKEAAFSKQQKALEAQVSTSSSIACQHPLLVALCSPCKHC